MTYNIHPIIVHFPIALLFVYSIIKILPLKKYMPSFAWKDIERVLLLLGVLGAFVASSTGEIAQELIQPNIEVVEMHELFANITVWMYGILLIGEILSMINVRFISKIQNTSVLKASLFIEKILTNTYVSFVLALIGLVALVVTGMLGGVMVYGTSADPLAVPVLNLLGIHF